MVGVVLVVAPLDFKRVRACSMTWARLLAEVRVVLLVAPAVDGVGFVGVRGCGRACWPSSGSFWWSLVDDFCVFKGVVAPSGRRLGRLGRLGWKLVDDFCGAGVGFLGVRGCGLRWWPLTWSSRCLRVVASRVGEASLGGVRLRLGGVRLRSRLWVVGMTRKDV